MKNSASSRIATRMVTPRALAPPRLAAYASNATSRPSRRRSVKPSTVGDTRLRSRADRWASSSPARTASAASFFDGAITIADGRSPGPHAPRSAVTRTNSANAADSSVLPERRPSNRTRMRRASGGTSSTSPKNVRAISRSAGSRSLGSSPSNATSDSTRCPFVSDRPSSSRAKSVNLTCSSPRGRAFDRCPRAPCPRAPLAPIRLIRSVGRRC